MSQNSKISWCDATWPIVAGCEYESPGCSNCWAVRDSWRLAHNPHAAVRAAFEGTVRKTETGALVWTSLVRTLPERLDWPLKCTGKGYFRVQPPAGKTSRYKFSDMEHLPEDLRVQEFPS